MCVYVYVYMYVCVYARVRRVYVCVRACEQWYLFVAGN